MPRPRSISAWIAVLLAASVFVAIPAEAFARSSGGYSRPSSSARTPSFGGGSGYRTPSTSGGYSRPAPSYSPPPVRSAPASPGDRSFSQDRSGAAFDAFRTQQDNARRPSFRPPAAQPQYRPPQNAAPQYAPQYQQPRSGYAQAPARSGWFNDRGYSAPAQGYFGGGRSFGVWDGLFLGAMLSNLTRSGGDFFHNNQNDPGYRQWRAEADRQAQDNADLRRQLDDLDRQLAERSGQPKTPGALPPEVPAELAKAPPDRTPSTGGGWGWVPVVVLVGGAGIGYLAWQRRRTKPGGSSVTPPANGVLGSAGAMLRHKLSGEPYTPDKFRVGMTMALDPTPFILAGHRDKAHRPGRQRQRPDKRQCHRPGNRRPNQAASPLFAG